MSSPPSRLHDFNTSQTYDSLRTLKVVLFDHFEYSGAVVKRILRPLGKILQIQKRLIQNYPGLPFQNAPEIQANFSLLCI